MRKFSDPKSADWKCRPYVPKSTFLVLPSTKRNWLFEAVHAICKPFQSKNVDIACWITFYLQKTFSLVMKTELLLSINAKATSNRLGTPHRAVWVLYNRLFFRDFPATNTNKFSEKLSYGKISLSYRKISLSCGENSWIFGKFASKTWFLGGIKQFFSEN